MRVKLFGPLVDVVGSSEIEIEGICDTDSLKQKMLSDYPDIKKYTFLISVCRKIPVENISLKPEDEVALLPPFAGG